MRYCVDTWFLLELNKRDERAVRIFRETLEGKNRMIIPTVTVLELIRSNIKAGERLSKSDSMLNELKATQKVQLIALDETVAKEAAKVSITHGVPTIDSVVAATCKLSNCDRLLSKDSHLKKLDSKKYLQIECW